MSILFLTKVKKLFLHDDYVALLPNYIASSFFMGGFLSI